MNKNNELYDAASCSENQECPVTNAMDVIGGKWKVIILYHLRDNTLRFGELRKRIPKITQKMLTQQLRELESNNLVERKVYAEVPPKVEYTSTDIADELRPIMDMLCDWSKRNHEQINAAE
ncbi:winged helix-turn-helix transcriptional regulator [Pseudoteredinibacter isoporae]|uniref:DNA-binding HxlR family transcriptional regulator n=1 Tax=Pseudoteredinibacter isoporae TaxID=570281 RepID=A0A7X0JSE7_9GAMM|nr:helix-turn-helix domain-containing protein [Pseudoteredinibacter isoporae]MBB6521302.1 DNA-binding HxlR family transcriptional regulator [Pseudoteredinibacter isoporae]